MRFEIESLRSWERSHFGVEPSASLDELAALDPAREVDWVLGLVTPLRGVATSIHQIGYAIPCSRHLVMRGMDDEQEILALEQEYRLLSVEERQRLYGDRKAHKEVVVFLHEWGHTMGLLHNEDRSIIMNPNYDPKQRAFSDFEKRVVTLVVARRLGRPSEHYPESAELAALLAAAPADEGSDRARAELLELVRGRAGRGARPRGGDPQAGGRERERAGGRASDRAGGRADRRPHRRRRGAFNRAVEAANAGRAEEAWTLLAPVIRNAGGRKTSAKAWAMIAGLAAATGAYSAAAEAATRAEPHRRRRANRDGQRRVRAPPAGAAGGRREVRRAGRQGARLRRRLLEDRAVGAVRRARRRAGRAARLRVGVPRRAGRRRPHLRSRAPGQAPGGSGQELRGRAREVQGGDARALPARHGGVQRRPGRGRRAAPLAGDPPRPGRSDAWKTLAGMYRTTGAKQRLARLADEHQALLSSPLPGR